ncbi:MAG: glycosyltransferase, partial [Lachnospiraceae bacterium]|nr:glycosyltransferase [Lachnospiraceae bacterium]
IPVSICTIIKNEEKHLGNFLNAIKSCLKDYPHETVIVDTGSDDGSLDIIDAFIFDNPGESIVKGHFDWTGDFSAAKNHAVSLASNNWMLVLDADEYLSSFDKKCMEMMELSHKKDAGFIDIVNHTAEGRTNDRVLRLFNRKYYRFEGIVHEQLVPCEGTQDNAGSKSSLQGVQAHAVSYIAVPIKIDHYGYMGTPEELKKKVERNNELLFKMLKETPDDPYLYFQIGQSYAAIKDHEKAYEYFGKGLESEVDERLDYVRQMVVGYGHAMLDTGREKEALSFEGIYENFSDSADFLCLMGLIYMRNGIIDRSYEEFDKAVKIKECDVEGTNSYISYFNMAVIDEATGNIGRARELYKKCGDFAPAKERLKEIK